MAAAHAQMLPAIVQDEIYESRKNCEPDHAKMNSNFIVERDINGDGRKDYILHYKQFQCGDNGRSCHQWKTAVLVRNSPHAFLTMSDR
jgi:hypothetical protein